MQITVKSRYCGPRFGVRNRESPRKTLRKCIYGKGITSIYIYVDCSINPRAVLHVKSIKEQKFQLAYDRCDVTLCLEVDSILSRNETKLPKRLNSVFYTRYLTIFPRTYRSFTMFSELYFDIVNALQG